MVTGHEVTVLAALVAGLLSFLSPCTLPLFPSFLSFVAGVSFDDLQTPLANTRTRRAIIVNALLFTVGFTLVFVSLGASFSVLGSLLFTYQVVIRRGGGALVVLFGLYVTGWLRLPVLMRERRIELKDRPAGYLGAVLIGITFAAGWIPCVGPILGSILLLASTTKMAATGVSLLLAYSLGMAIPFIASALAFSRFLTLFDRYKRFLPAVSVISGLFLILIGGLLMSNYFSVLSGYALKFTPQWLFDRL
ncbi:MAG: cytochrome c biogenesis protein CcdA [candidate division NC10 bacterium]|nr:cytochrome c biogenesis protein CcdA [candidate division NC10 bacterium]